MKYFIRISKLCSSLERAAQLLATASPAYSTPVPPRCVDVDSLRGRGQTSTEARVKQPQQYTNTWSNICLFGPRSAGRTALSSLPGYFLAVSAARICGAFGAMDAAKAHVKSLLDETSLPTIQTNVSAAQYLHLARNLLSKLPASDDVSDEHFVRLHKTIHLVVHLLGKHPGYSALPAADRAWTVSAATQAMYRLEQMKPLLIQQHASAPQAPANSQMPASSGGAALAARLAALKAPASSPALSETPGASAAHAAPHGDTGGADTPQPDAGGDVCYPPAPPQQHEGVVHGPPAADGDAGLGGAAAEAVRPPSPPPAPSPEALPSAAQAYLHEAGQAPTPAAAAGTPPPSPPAAASAPPQAALRNVAEAPQLRQFAPLVGIRNPGSMCYISASVAALLRCASLDGSALLHTAGGAGASSAGGGHASLLGALRVQASLMASAHRAGEHSVDLFDGVCAHLREHGLRNTVGEEGDAQEAVATIVSALSEAKCPQSAAFQFDTQVIWRKADGCTKLLRPEPCTMLHLPVPVRYLSGRSATAVPLEHCLGEALEPSGQSGERFTTVVTKCPDTLLLHIRRNESITAAQAAGMALPPDMPASGPDVICPDVLSLRDKHFRLRGIVAHQRLQAGALSAAGARSTLHRGSKFAHPVQSVVVSGGSSSATASTSSTLDQGHYIALAREADSNACVLYSDSSAQFFSHEQDAMTSPLQAYMVLYEQQQS